jgi:DNA modification methylase
VTYEELLVSKRVSARACGFEVLESDINPMLFPFQRDIVKWALRLGRAAIFSECGTGKTPMQLEWARHIAQRAGPVLILAPLAVAHQTVCEGVKFGIKVTQVLEDSDWIDSDAIWVTNYDRLKKFDCSKFAGVVLDESSILKAFSGTTKRLILETFENTRYKLACTATPAPNDLLELGNHAEFLGVMPSNEMISRWFINNSMSFGDYRLKGHAERDYWRWLASYAVSVSKPSDLGYPDDGFITPPLTIHRHVVPVDHTASADGMLFRVGDLSATSLHKEMRLTAADRSAVVAEMVNSSSDSWIVWCNANYEADELKARIPGAVEVRGNEAVEVKERKLNQFSDGSVRVIITKPSIAGFGLNWQHCCHMAFVGLSFSYEQQYQAMRRSYRFGQRNEVHVHIVSAETEGKVAEAVAAKAAEHEKLQRAMVEAMRESQLESIYGARKLTMEYDHHVEAGENWEMHLGDCVDITKQMPDESVGLSVFSPPFSNLYIYSDSIRDMGNTANDSEFMASFEFLIAELYRVTISGRICAVHCKDLPRYKGTHGAAGLWDFPGSIIAAFERHGWQYHSRVTIWKDPVIEMQRTKNHGLLYKQLRKDSSASRQGMADYVIAFRKWPDDNTQEFPNPVTHTHEDFPLDQWQQWASPVWMDIRQTNVLNVQQARAEHDEKHICPLQLDVIERCVMLWSNKGDAVYSPFAGIGSEPYMAVRLGRRGLGCELKREYFDIAVRNLKRADSESGQDLLPGVGPEESGGAGEFGLQVQE